MLFRSTTLYESNIQVTTTRRIKDTYYKDNARVLTFEDLIEICRDKSDKWIGFDFSVDQLNTSINILNQQIEKHKEHLFVENKFKTRLEEYLNKLNQLI